MIKKSYKNLFFVLFISCCVLLAFLISFFNVFLINSQSGFSFADAQELPEENLLEILNDDNVSVYTLNKNGKLYEDNLDLSGKKDQCLLNARAADMGAINALYNEALNSGNSFSVAIDPGHGGNDSGATCYGLKESDVNWDVANACANQLNQYRGVNAFLIRNYYECPNQDERAYRAINWGANLLISIHMNSSNFASGAEVLVPHPGGWRDDFYWLTGNIGNMILDKICSYFKIPNRGLKPREEWSRSYPDGSVGDWAGVIYYARYYQLPSFLVEHAFIDGDYSILQDYNNRQILGRFDAEAIAQQYGFSKAPRGENIVGTYTLEMKSSSSAVVDVKNSDKSSGANVQIETKSSIKDSQKWRIVTDSDGYAVVKNVNSGCVLDVADGSSVDRSNILQYSFNNTDAQKWSFVKNNDGSYTIYSKLGYDKVVDVDNNLTESGTNIKLYGANGNNAQKFVLRKVEQPEKGECINGTYYIKSFKDNNFCLDVSGGSIGDGSNIQLYKKNNSKAQEFRISCDSANYATIQNINSGKVLDVYSGWTYPCSNVQQYSSNGSDAQKWKIVKSNTGYYFMPKCNENIALDIQSGKVESGSNIWTYYFNESPSQIFDLENLYDDLAESSANISENDYSIFNKITKTRSLEIKGLSLDNGAVLQQNKKDDFSGNKFFNIKKIGNYYYFINKYSGKALDAAGGNVSGGTKVHQWDFNSGIEAQMWAAYDQGNGEILFQNRMTKGFLTLRDGKDKDYQEVYADTTFKSESSQLWKIEAHKLEGEVFENQTVYIDSFDNSNMTFDVCNGSKDNGANIQLYSKNGSPAQLWKINTDKSTKLSTITNVGSGKVLDIYNGNFSKGANIQQYQYNSSIAQKWKIVKDNDGYRIISAASDYLCIDLAGGNYANGTNVQLYSSNNTLAQKFKITDIHGKKGEDINGTYFINMTSYQFKSLDVAGASTADGANVQIYEGNGSAAQQWKISTDANGESTIINVGSKKALDVNGDHYAPGTNVWQYSPNGTTAQKWKFVKQGSGYKIISALNDSVCLDVAGGQPFDGTNVWIYSDNGSSAQNFVLSTTNGPIAASTVDIPQSTYRINAVCACNKVLDVTGGSSWNGNNIQTYDWNGSNAQIFTAIKEGNYYRFVNYATGKSLDVTGGSFIPGTNVQIWDSCSGSKNQLWAAYGTSATGEIEFVNCATGMALDVFGGEKTNATNIDVYPRNNTSAQHFKIFHADPQPMGTPIMYGSRATASQMVNLFNYYHKVYPAWAYSDKGAPTINDFCNICCSEAIMEGVDPAVLFCQAMKETGWLQFGGQVQPQQCNFGGLGVTNGGSGGAWFNTVWQGLRAQVQHLKLYASAAPLVNPCIDPRWDAAVNAYGRGSAPCVENLNGKWAVPGDGYGESIVAIMQELSRH